MIAFLNIFNLILLQPTMAKPCSEFYHQWQIPTNIISYIISSSKNHAELERKNYDNFSSCSNASYTYSEKTKSNYNPHNSLLNIESKKIESFLQGCIFSNNMIENSQISLEYKCPNRYLAHERSERVNNTELFLYCSLNEPQKHLVIKIGEIEYRFPYKKNESYFIGGHQRNLEKNIDLSTVFIKVNNTFFESCSEKFNYSLNFCLKKEEGALKASKSSLVCEIESSSSKYCIYGNRTGNRDSLKIEKEESCALDLLDYENYQASTPCPRDYNRTLDGLKELKNLHKKL
jgi:hypothetical protein